MCLLPMRCCLQHPAPPAGGSPGADTVWQDCSDCGLWQHCKRVGGQVRLRHACLRLTLRATAALPLLACLLSPPRLILMAAWGAACCCFLPAAGCSPLVCESRQCGAALGAAQQQHQKQQTKTAWLRSRSRSSRTSSRGTSSSCRRWQRRHWQTGAAGRGTAPGWRGEPTSLPVSALPPAGRRSVEAGQWGSGGPALFSHGSAALLRPRC
jgi:hypothetical protein